MDTIHPRPIRILGIGGSTRQNSTSLALLKATLNLAEQAGAQTVLADRALGLPIYNPDHPLGDYPDPDRPLDEVRMADAYLLCSPTYHGTVAGGVKNAFFDALNFLRTPHHPISAAKSSACSPSAARARPTSSTASTTPPAPSTASPHRPPPSSPAPPSIPTTAPCATRPPNNACAR